MVEPVPIGDDAEPARPWWWSTGFGLVLTLVAVLWAIEVIDTVVLGDRLEGGGIHPRRVDGLDGILWAPFLHRGFGHLLSNTVPVLVLGGLVAFAGLRRWLDVTAAVILGGGALTWLLARSGNHLGASILTFGWLGYLMAAAFIERSLRSLGLALVAVVLYWTMIFGFVPRSGVSWEGHLFGAIAGVTAAFVSIEGGLDRLAPPDGQS